MKVLPFGAVNSPIIPQDFKQEMLFVMNFFFLNNNNNYYYYYT